MKKLIFNIFELKSEIEDFFNNFFSKKIVRRRLLNEPWRDENEFKPDFGRIFEICMLLIDHTVFRLE